MDDREVGKLWDANAAAWTALSRAGYDVCRDGFNTPAFLAMLPDVAGLRGLDVGCGEGHNTRLVVRRGARMSAVDIAPGFIRYAEEEERREPLGIAYAVATGTALPFRDASFDFAVAFMSFMDMMAPDAALAEVRRVLRPGAFFQFSITHPCYDTPYRQWVRDEQGRQVALAVAEYFRPVRGEICEWIFYSAPDELKERYPKFRIPIYHRPLGQWLNAVVDAGFRLERVNEPRPDDEALARRPDLHDAGIVAFYFHILCRKP